VKKFKMSVYTILISGEVGAGKTTTADALLDAVRKLAPPDTYVTVGQYGDELKRECAERAKVDISLFYSHDGKNTFIESVGMTAGRMLQVVGEEERQRDKNYWIDKLKESKKKELTASGKKKMLLIVGDCRHPNEIDDMRPGLAVRLEGDPGNVRATSTRDLSHPSETSLRDYEWFDLRFDTDTQRTAEIVAVILQQLGPLN
jgi:hypothetical protein